MFENFVLHKFRPTETIDAVMRLKGRHNYTLEELVVLRARFNRLNGAIVPYPGDTFKIPLELLPIDDNSLGMDVGVFVPVISNPGSEGQEPADGKHTGDPSQPNWQLPAEPKASAPVQKTAEQNGNQQMPPTPGEHPSQKFNEPEVEAVQPILVISGARRRSEP